MTDHEKNHDLQPSDSDHSSPPSVESHIPDQTITEFELFEYYPEEGKYRALYDADRDSPSTAIVSAVAAASETDPLDMEPLHTVVDSDALDSLVTPNRPGVGDLHITFEYVGCEVTASSYGSLKVKPLQESPSPPAADD